MPKIEGLKSQPLDITIDITFTCRTWVKTTVLPRSQQYEDQVREDLSLMFLSGVSTRPLSLISKRLLGRNLSHEEVSKANLTLTEAVEKWRNRDLSKEVVKYLFLDGVNLYISPTPLRVCPFIPDALRTYYEHC